MHTCYDSTKILKSFRNTQVGYITEYMKPIGETEKITDYISALSDFSAISAIPIETSKGIGLLSIKDILRKSNLLFSSLSNSVIENDINIFPVIVDALENINDVMKKMTERKDNQFEDFIITYKGKYLGIGSLVRLGVHVSKMKNIELDKAKEIQGFLMRNSLKDGETISVKTFIKSANKLGGDFYFSSELYSGLFVTACFDVSGKSISASLTTSMIGAVFSTLINSGKVNSMKPCEIIQLLNKVACDQTPDEVFISGTILFTDIKKKEAELYNMGHTPALVYINNSDKMELLNPNFLPLGIDCLHDPDKYAQKISLSGGLKIFLYSDGLNDMHDIMGERYGYDKLINFIHSRFSLSGSEIISELKKEISSYTDGVVIPDDITFIISEYFAQTA